MNYPNVVPGIFRSRPNRFIAQVDIDGQQETVHVKNTGRCKELLVPGARVYLQDCQSPARKTRYDLIAVEKGDLLINMDSQAPNRVAAEYLPRRFPDLQLLRPETVYGNSRFDFYLSARRLPRLGAVHSPNAGDARFLSQRCNGPEIFRRSPSCSRLRCGAVGCGLQCHAGFSHRLQFCSDPVIITKKSAEPLNRSADFLIPLTASPAPRSALPVLSAPSPKLRPPA